MFAEHLPINSPFPSFLRRGDQPSGSALQEGEGHGGGGSEGSVFPRGPFQSIREGLTPAMNNLCDVGAETTNTDASLQLLLVFDPLA